MSFQTTIIVGNLGRDPEMRYTPVGDPVTNFSVAVNKNKKNADGTKTETVAWFRVSTWGKTAETCNQYLHKGSKVVVEGELQYDPKTGGPVVFERRDGTMGASFEIRASTVRFESTKAEDEAHNAGAEGAAEYVEQTSGEPATTRDPDDIPF